MPRPGDAPDHAFETIRLEGCGHEVFRLETGYVVRCGRRLLEHEPRMHPVGVIQPLEPRDPS